MPLTMQNLESSPTFDAQAIPDATDWAALILAVSGTAVINGCTVAANATPSTSVQVAAGKVTIANTDVTVAATSVTPTSASSTDRKDIVVVNSSGVVSVVAGTPCGTAGWSRYTTAGNYPPVKPAIPANSVLLAELYVASTTTTFHSYNIIDKTTLVVFWTVSEAEQIMRLTSLDQFSPPVTSIIMNSQKLIQLAPGVLSTDSVNLSQLPSQTTITAIGTTSNNTTGTSVNTIVSNNSMLLTSTAAAAGFTSAGGYVALSAGSCVVQYTGVSGSTLTGLTLISGTGSATVTNGTTTILPAFVPAVTGNYLVICVGSGGGGGGGGTPTSSLANQTGGSGGGQGGSVMSLMSLVANTGYTCTIGAAAAATGTTTANGNAGTVGNGGHATSFAGPVTLTGGAGAPGTGGGASSTATFGGGVSTLVANLFTSVSGTSTILTNAGNALTTADGWGGNTYTLGGVLPACTGGSPVGFGAGGGGGGGCATTTHGGGAGSPGAFGQAAGGSVGGGTGTIVNGVSASAAASTSYGAGGGGGGGGATNTGLGGAGGASGPGVVFVIGPFV